MKSKLYFRSFLKTIAIFLLIITFQIYSQQRPERSGASAEIRKPANNQQPAPPQRISQPQQIQRPIVNNPAPSGEQKRPVLNEPSQRMDTPRQPQRTETIRTIPPDKQKRNAVDEESNKKTPERQPVREERIITQPDVNPIRHDPYEEESNSGVYYTETVCDPYPTFTDPIYYPPIIINEPIYEYLPSPSRPINKLSLKEQAIQNYYDEYYYDAIIDLNAAIKKDSLDFELYFWRGMSWFKLDEYDSSIVDLSKYLKFYSDDAEAHFYRGLSNLYLTNKLEAYHDLLKANELGYEKANDILSKYFKDYHI